jgi:hypothetical protein
MLQLTFEFPVLRGGLIIAIQSQSSLLECEFPTNALFATFVRVPATMLCHDWCHESSRETPGLGKMTHLVE